MKEMKKSCKNCEFNFDGICVGNSHIYKHGEKIQDETQDYNCWSPDVNYFLDANKNLPRFLREERNAGHPFFARYEDYSAGNPVEINFFDAVKYVYGVSMVDIAVLMNVTFGVVHRAKLQGIPQKRVKQFCDVLCITPELLNINTTAVFEELEKSKVGFFKQDGIQQKLSAMPDWKEELARTISGDILNCPIHIAKELTRVDKFDWEDGVSMDEYTESEKMFIEYACKHTSKQLIGIEYQLDRGCIPHYRTKYL